MVSSEPIIGPIKPYGPPIRDAVASGDTGRMRRVSDNAHRWLEEYPHHKDAGEVRAALADLDSALTRA
ncbi:DUF1843 domain-containing protein [Longimicrobium terrae]|jgi:hypothetical protein|uniref:DUF1843 domain-containing protein n=1 Tax=Longimicrobium terrae TaxID=1639882 RepID=A0A841GXW0_9BACT|nr:DUF1843 domain-containing protein [Longimicrobium terrae]MBB4636187.1 hypothetical protein [Longimicrobium terrae]MBB6070582.1 hypothetical protein [Longimicrobium terrae]NNC29567.1 DUF1843 domain-containing protein [Longimicrobium terrae]